MLKIRTKIEAIALTLFLISIAVGSVWAVTTFNDSAGTISRLGFRDPTLIWNSNGQSWVATAENLQLSLNQTGITYFPATTIITNKTITMPSNSALIGSDRTKCILKAGNSLGGNHNHVLINADATNGNSDLYISGITVDANEPTKTIRRYGIFWSKVDNSTVENVIVQNTGKDGLRLFHCKWCVADNIIARDTGHHSVMFCYGTSYSIMSNVLVYNNSYEPYIIEHPHPVTGEKNHHITMSNLICNSATQFSCYVSDAYAITVDNIITENARDGFKIRDASDVTVNNYIARNVQTGAGLKVGPNATNIRISNSIVECITACGLEVRGPNTDGVTFSNVATRNGTRPVYMVSAAPANNVTFIGCDFKDYSNYLIGYGNDIQFIGCKIRTKYTPAYFVSIQRTARRWLIQGNDFTWHNSSNRPINVVSTDSKVIIRDNPGAPRDYFQRNGGGITCGTNGVYGANLTIVPESGRIIVGSPLQLRDSGSVGVGETITIQIFANYASGTYRSITKTYTAPAASYKYNFTYDDWLALARTSTFRDETLVSLHFRATSTNAVTSSQPRVYFMQS